MKIAIYGYGNLGRGVELALKAAPDTECVGVFTRRAPETVKTLCGAPVFRAADVLKYKDDIDVLIICGGSATDLPVMTPDLAKNFNVVDSFDTHAEIPKHFDNVDLAAKSSDKTALISCGWDPGMFSLARLYGSSILGGAAVNTFWGKGVSQGHSDAIRRIDGVLDARQYTVPVESTVEAVRNGDSREFTARQKHLRECFIVAKEGADKQLIEKTVKQMPNYFADYDTTVHFITAQEMAKNHSALFHGGTVIISGTTGNGNLHTVEYSLKLDSNPEFTASVLVAFARAIDRMNKKGDFGAKTVFDIPPALLSPLSPEEIRKKLL